MLEGPERGSKVSQMNGMQLKNKFNRIFESLGHKEKGIRSALPQKHKGILFETDDDSTTNWLRKMLELPHGNHAGLILRYDNALCFLVPLLSLYDIMPHVAYFIIIPWNESHDHSSH